MEGEGAANGTGVASGTGQPAAGGGGEQLGWRAQLSDDLKANETFTGYKTVSDFAKAHLDALGKAKELEGKLSTAIFKPGEKATTEEQAVFLKALGVPEKPEEYVFEGEKNSPEMVSWAQKVFHKLGVPKETGVALGKEWNAFLGEMEKAQEKLAAEAKAKAEEELKKELGGEEKYKEVTTLVSRLLKEAAKPEELEHLNATGIGNDPIVVRLISRLAKKTGEDTSLPGSRGSERVTIGFNYNKSPTPPKN